MNKFLSGLFLVTFIFDLQAQVVPDKDLQSLVDAERAFIRYAKEKNTRDAFIAFLADDAVTAAPGQGPRVGKKYLEDQKPNESYLHWELAFSDIASSGDFGYNTGPWEFREKKTDEKAVAFGQFVSVWKKSAGGKWKVAIDIGITHEEPKERTNWTASSVKLKPPRERSTGAKNEIFDVEKRFIVSFAEKGNKAYKSLLSAEAKFYRSGRLPCSQPAEVQELLNAPPGANISYTFMNGDVATSGDLAFVYGQVSYEAVLDGATEIKHGSYMRFWKKEDGKNWKIVLDLITN